MSSWTPAPVGNVHNPHKLQQQLEQCHGSLKQCHRSLRVILMPSNSTDFNQILNLAYSGHMQTIQKVIKDISPSQERPASSKPPAMSSIFESVLDAFKLNRFQPNFKHSSLRAYADHP